jgi:hypothetical protein
MDSKGCFSESINRHNDAIKVQNALLAIMT